MPPISRDRFRFQSSYRVLNICFEQPQTRGFELVGITNIEQSVKNVNERLTEEFCGKYFDKIRFCQKPKFYFLLFAEKNFFVFAEILFLQIPKFCPI